jgi:hypothetical protein
MSDRWRIGARPRLETLAVFHVLAKRYCRFSGSRDAIFSGRLLSQNDRRKQQHNDDESESFHFSPTLCCETKPLDADDLDSGYCLQRQHGVWGGERLDSTRHVLDQLRQSENATSMRTPHSKRFIGGTLYFF